MGRAAGPAAVPRSAPLTLTALLAIASACDATPPARADAPRAADSASGAPRAAPAGAAVVVHAADKLRSIESGRLDPLGRPIRVACVTCHSLRKAETLPSRGEDLTEFHRGLQVSHGKLSCDSCHAAERPHDRLRLANGATIEMSEAQTLCSQCHGPQRKSYDKGAHGGMTGYWDTRRGGRVRNDCVDCHDPHAPAFAPAEPVLPPRDRGLSPPKKGAHP